MFTDWTGSTRSRQQQLTCKPLGSYTKYSIPIGTCVRISRSKYGPFKTHKTRIELTFDKASHSTPKAIQFFHDGFYIWANRQCVNTGDSQ